MMSFIRVALVGLCAMLAAGCVSSDTHRQALAELERARTSASRTAADLDAYKKQAAAEAEAARKKSAQDLAALKEDKARLAADLHTAKASLAETQAALDTTGKNLAAEQENRRDLEGQVKKLQDRNEKVQQSLSETSARGAALEKEKEQFAAALAEARDQGKELATKLATEQVKVAILREDKQRLLSGTTTAREEVARMQVTLQQQEERLKSMEAEKAKLEQERAARDAGTLRLLSRAQEDFARSFETEMVRGDILITPNRDRLTVRIADRLLFESGQSQVKPAGLKFLKLAADLIKTAPDRQVLVEGHTDNVPIREKLRDKFPTNWELSAVRAASVARHLIEQGGVDRALLSAEGHADTKPVADNDTEEGRKANRRIEITLYPKDLAEIANQTKP
ncbi:MAG: OmpA family protein [Nitrospirota bacterium]|nr:OmpA family protein [Nitrospirota bacterium]